MLCLSQLRKIWNTLWIDRQPVDKIKWIIEIRTLTLYWYDGGSVLRYCLSRPSCSIRMCRTHMTSSTSVSDGCACECMCAQISFACIRCCYTISKVGCVPLLSFDLLFSYSTLHCWQFGTTDCSLKHTAGIYTDTQ